MAKLPSSFRSKNETTKGFRLQYARLPDSERQRCRKACKVFDRDPNNRSLRHKKLVNINKSSHKDETYSVSISMDYRALYVKTNGINVWHWIGNHSDYNTFTGKK